MNRRMYQRSVCSVLGHLLGCLVIFSAAALLVVGYPVAEAEASSDGDHVEFTVTVDTAAGADSDDDVRARTRQKVNEEVARRIERRLETIGVRDFEVDPLGSSELRVKAYGDHSSDVVKGAVIPRGMVEVRPVLADANPWLEIAAQLPDGVEFYNEPGALRPNSFFLYASTPRLLYESMELLPADAGTIQVFPHEAGWRTLNLGDPLSTHDDVADVSLARNRAGSSFVTLTMTGEATQRIRSQAGDGTNQLAFVVDGEVVAVEYFHAGSFSETVTLDPPEHLDSLETRINWAKQVAGRMAAPIPVRLAEFEE